jgi:EAL domain-containing protein (putative c-di-GMP-specific phosphodiesterase class I)/GGDEF domain-containing protein
MNPPNSTARGPAFGPAERPEFSHSFDPLAAGATVALGATPPHVVAPADLEAQIEASLRLQDPSAGAMAVYTIGIRHVPFTSLAPGQRNLSGSAFAEIVLAEVHSAVTQAVERRRRPSSDPQEILYCELDRSRFCIAVPGIRDTETAMGVGEALGARFAQPFAVKGLHVRLHAEIGFALCPAPGVKSAQEVIARSETAMFCAAHVGDRTPQVFGEAMDEWRTRREELERDLTGAIERGELAIFYQPRVLTKTREIVGMEALIRWKHPKHGLVSPNHFIPIAEQNGLIEAIGDFVIRTSLTQLKAWDAAGYRELRVGVNLSAAQFRDSSLFDKIVKVVRETGVAPHRLELELTEGILMRDPTAAIQTLQQLRGAGVQISVDDFGTGYSSLSYLRRFPVNAMKIDQSFIRQVTNNPQDAAITTAIIVLGRSLNLTVVAEGVETESQLGFLRVLECDEVQGYLFGRPAEPADAVATVVKKS